MLTEELGRAFVKELKEGFDAVLNNESIIFELAEVQIIEVFAKDALDNEIKVKIIGNILSKIKYISYLQILFLRFLTT